MTSALSILTDEACTEALAFADLLDSIASAAYDTPTPCTGWTVARSRRPCRRGRVP